MTEQSNESQGRDTGAHKSVTGDEWGNSTGVYIVTRSWKNMSTAGILGVSLGGLFSIGTGVWRGRN